MKERKQLSPADFDSSIRSRRCEEHFGEKKRQKLRIRAYLIHKFAGPIWGGGSGCKESREHGGI